MTTKSILASTLLCLVLFLNSCEAKYGLENSKGFAQTDFEDMLEGKPS